ncbi:hypothetical protein H0H87_003659 [Tephrocybe sp. NHM501043]|nr:hypothetical protein H0H87_003659 [Tephrocybe sp. NHM501043]
MDSLHFDPYLPYADAAPRTPSPHDVHFAHYKQPLDHPTEPRIFEGPNDDAAVTDNVYQQPFYHSRGSLLQELYDHDLAEQQQQQQQPQYPQPDASWEAPQYHMVRRATFPYVRQDRDDGLPLQQYPPFMQHYAEPLPELHPPYADYDDAPSIKLEDSSLMVPSQPAFYPRPPSAMPIAYLSPHSGLPVQHTDDAASKETQYLRRRCFNCHTTEPPSWRRSTLNPGKIVCNKCGLYERTHLRPRPLRFDELRAGNKARSTKTKGTVSPKAKLPLVKKEPRDYNGLVRRASVSSSSSVHSGSGASDWDDNVSVYSSGSAPPTSFNSPATLPFPLDRTSQSPPRDGPIRLPPAPLSDLQHQHDYFRRNSVSAIPEHAGEATGWQPISASASPQAQPSPLEIALPALDESLDGPAAAST